MSSVDQETKSSRWNWEVRQGDVMERLREMEPESVHCCVTSPPYWGLRNYGVDGAYGLEPTLDEYICQMVEVFREVRRVLRKDATLWLNLGDAYTASPKGSLNGQDKSGLTSTKTQEHSPVGVHKRGNGLKPKDLIGLPWRLAFALQADGWWLRSDIVWHKPNPMPEPVTDRPTRAHEYVFLLSKAARYFYDADAIREPMAESSIARISQESFWEQTGGEKDHRNGVNPNRSARQSLENLAHKADKQRGHSRRHAGFNDRWDGMSNSEQQAMGANKRTVWSIATQPYKEAHFATFPEKLVEPCILAGTSEKGVCAECGAPWTRIVEKSPSTMNIRVRDAGKGVLHLKSGCGGGAAATDSEVVAYGPEQLGGPVTAISWQPSCGHNAEAVPAVVIDPFCGSGTTGVVALRHGRLFIGVELNPEYVELARRRIIGDAPLLNGNGRGGVKLLSESGPADGESD